MDSSAANAMKILVVDDDSTCLAVVAALLRKWNFQVVTVKDPREALIILGGVEGGFDVVIADVYMPEMNGFQLQQQITTDFQLPVILMSVDERENLVARGVDFGATLFISKPVSVNDVRNYVWQITAASKKKDQNSNNNVIPPPAPDHDQATAAAPTSTDDNPNNSNYEITREGELTFKTHKLTGKKKLVWTATLHYKFLDAITILGLNNAVPKRILEVMDVPGITRDNVASHLQKYRMFLGRVSELSMPRQRNVDWRFGRGVNFRPRIADRRYGGMFSLINYNQISLGGGRWNITAEEQLQPPPITMPPAAAAGTFSSSFLFSNPSPRLAVASPPNNQPSWSRPGYGGLRQSSLLLSPHHHHHQQQQEQQQLLFNFGLQSSPLIRPAAASTNMVNPIYRRSFTSFPPLVIRGNNNNDAIAPSPPVPTLQLQRGGGSSMRQPQTYNNNNNNNNIVVAETTRNEMMVRGAIATRPNQLSGGGRVAEVPPDPLGFDFLLDDDGDLLKFLLSDPMENQSYSDDNASQNNSTEGGGNRPFSPLFVPDHDPTTVQPQLTGDDDLPPPPSHPLHGYGIGSNNNNNTTGGDEASSQLFDMSLFADDHQLNGGGLAATHDLIISNNNNNDYENENSNFSSGSAVNLTTQYYDDHEDLPSIDQLLLEPRIDEQSLDSIFASTSSAGGAEEDDTSKN